jgi:hypothetical protein
VSEPDDAELDALPRVAASEAELIAIARALIAPGGRDVWPTLAAGRALPAAIGPTCEALFADALALAWPALWRRDGGGPRASLTDGGRRVVRGRLWERCAPAPLRFTAATLQLVRWLVASPLGAGTEVAELDAMPLSIGDEVALYLALDLAAGTAAQRVLARQPMTRASPLAWLGFAHWMAGPPPSFAPRATGAGAVVVDALGRELAARWRAVELGKAALEDPDELLAYGRGQAAALDGFMAACDAAGRRDLAGFVIDAARPLLADGERRWPAPRRLDPSTSLKARTAARQAAGALLRAVRRWAAWDEQHRGVRFIDDDYEAAQLLLARFEPIGRAGAETAAALLAGLADLAGAAPTPAPNSTTIEAP